MVDLAIDVGGTFTDIVACAADGTLVFHKELNESGDHLGAVLRGIESVLEHLNVGWVEVGLIVHGTTIATNAVLTGDGARVALLTTAGFRDTLALRRGRRTDLYNNKMEQPRSLVPRALRLGIPERILWDGSVFQPLDEEAVSTALNVLTAAGAESVAVCFLHSYANDTHERRAGQLAKSHPELLARGSHVSVSAEIAPEMGYYERTSTTVLDAFVAPKVVSYLRAFESSLAIRGFRGTCTIMQANAGEASIDAAIRSPISTLNSGPTGGANAGAFQAAAMGIEDCITFDMGGTSCDVCLISGGKPSMTTESVVADQHLRMRVTDIVTIGAGGGSVVDVGKDGFLHVGPKSVGADPGPACYGRGGEAATVTDIDLVLGLLDADYFYGGRLHLNLPAAEKALQRVAERLGSDTRAMAEAAFLLVNSSMADAVREVSIFRGLDPRRLPLIVGGGAGPLHACEVARMLEMPLVVVPRSASVFSATGLLASDVRHDRVRVVGPLALADLDPEWADAEFGHLRKSGMVDLANSGFDESRRRFELAIDLRYEGQFQTITLPYFDDDPVSFLRTAFNAAHRDLFGYASESDPLEVLALRCTAVGIRDHSLSRNRPQFVSGVRAAMGSFASHGAAERVEAEELQAQREGPVLVADPYWTAWIPEGFVCALDAIGNLLAAGVENSRLVERLATDAAQ